jgi:hypothetical protein
MRSDRDDGLGTFRGFAVAMFVTALAVCVFCQMIAPSIPAIFERMQ